MPTPKITSQSENHGMDVSVIVTMHNEGVVGYKTLRNISLMVSNAKKASITCEVLIGLDKANDTTTSIAQAFKKTLEDTPCTIFETEFGDPGENRNNLIENSIGRYILVHDGDDLFTQNFIIEAYKMAESNDIPAVYIPQFLINFDGHHYMVPFVQSNSRTISKRFFFEVNYYTSQYLIEKSILQRHPYISTGNGWGYEDWWLNLELIADGIEFLTVSNTVFYYRRKKSNIVLNTSNTDSVLLPRTRLFEPRNYLLLPPVLRRRKTILKAKEDPEWRRTLKNITSRSSLAVALGKYYQSQKTLHLKAATFVGRNILRLQPQVILPEDWSKKVRAIMESNQKDVPPRMKAIGVKKTLIREWGKLNQIEPMIRASWDMFEFIPISFYPTDSGFSNAYYDFCKKYYNKKITDIIFVPHMIRGGAELATINLTKALSKQGKKVLVVSSLDTESVWGYRIREIEGASFIENKSFLINVPDPQMRMFFWSRVAQYWNIERITTVNSGFGYELIKRYSRQLKDMCIKTFVHTYAFDVTEDGFLFNYIPNGLVELYGEVDKYITDSQYYKNLLQEVNGFKETDVRTFYSPVDASKLIKKNDYRRKNKIIYAARICNQKIADVAVEVGRLLGQYGIELHFYGSIDPEYAAHDKFLNMIKDVPTIKYMGPFDGFKSLPLNDYDMLLLTTRTEGLAIAIIEACISEIYVMSVAVGGLPECVTNHKNGCLLPDTMDKFNPKAYLKAILNAYKTGECFNENAIHKQAEKVKVQHSFDTYSKNLEDIID